MKYLLEAVYSTEAWQAQIERPADRLALVQQTIATLGGHIEFSYLAIGDYETVTVFDMPDVASMLGFMRAVVSTKTVSRYRLTPLVAGDEGLAALRNAATLAYPSPVAR